MLEAIHTSPPQTFLAASGRRCTLDRRTPGVTGNQNQRAAAGPCWCVPCTLVVQLAPSLFIEERVAESWILALPDPPFVLEHERARWEWWVGRGSLPLIEASPGQYIGTSTNKEFGNVEPYHGVSPPWTGGVGSLCFVNQGVSLFRRCMGGWSTFARSLLTTPRR